MKKIQGKEICSHGYQREICFKPCQCQHPCRDHLDCGCWCDCGGFQDKEPRP